MTYIYVCTFCARDQLLRLELGEEELPQCTSLVHLNLYGSDIGVEEVGRLAVVLPQCTSLAHLHLGGNYIGVYPVAL